MYICCGEVSWGANEQGAGPYKGLPPHDIMLSEVSEEEEMLRDVIDERLQALDAIDCLLQDWQSRARREGPESLHRLEYALATLPILKQYFQSYLEGEESGESGEEEEDGTETSTALRLRIVERRLRSMEFCEGCPQADRREFIQEVDRVFADLKPSMDRYEQDRVLMTADERVPALRACYEEISKELRAIYITIRRRVVLDLVDMWDDVPEHIGKQDADHEDDDLYDPRHACCEWLLETAIFTGYSGPSASSSIQTAQGTSRLAQPRPSKSSAGLGTSAQRPCRKIGHEAKHGTSPKVEGAKPIVVAKTKGMESPAALRSNLAERSLAPDDESTKRQQMASDEIIVLSSDSEEEKDQAGWQAQVKRQRSR